MSTMTISRDVFGKLAEAILQVNARQATKYVSPSLTVKATRRVYKRSTNSSPTEIVFTIGPPNYAERKYIKLAQAAKEPFPIKRIALKFSPVAATSKPSALLTFRGIAAMTPKQRGRIADWLNQHADDLVKEGDRYASWFTGHYGTPTKAVLTINKAAEMAPQKRRRIAGWLRRQAEDLIKLGDQYARICIARYGR